MKNTESVRRLWAQTYSADQLESGFDPSTTFKPDVFPTEIGATLLTPADQIPGVKREPRCELIEEIARGGMGSVFRGRQPSLHRDVAFKVPLAKKESHHQRFFGEALITAQLDHPNIVPIYDLTITPDGDPALAMKLVGGKAWVDLLSDDIDFHLDVLISLTNAVAFAHSKNVVHNDLKPENVMVGEFGEVLLMDWGLAVDVSEERDPTNPVPHRSQLPIPCGTPTYMAPELAAGPADAVGPPTDVYLLGGILYEIITGRPPHRGSSLKEILRSVLKSTPPAFEDSVPDSLQAICRKAMALRPEDRFADASELRDALKAFRAHRESLAISERAAEILERCQVQVDDSVRAAGDRNRLYGDFAEAVAGFRQAQVLWTDNDDARVGEDRARFAFAHAALRYGDLGLADAQSELLRDSSQKARALRAAIEHRRQFKLQQRQQAVNARRTLMVAVAVIVMGLSVGLSLLGAEKRRVAESQTLAEARLQDIRRLADVKRLADLIAEVDQLWPAVPQTVPALDAWLGRADAILSRRAGHRAHLESLVVLSEDDRWERDTLARLVRDLDAFETGVRASLADRLEFARTVDQRTIVAPAEQWARARQSIAKSKLYRGLVLKPQLGLVPLGRDRTSRLWEFAHVQSGVVPQRDADGRFVIGPESGIVLVLLPGGRFIMGAAKGDKLARPIEKPAHAVELAPFFMAKYEVTQGQWFRVAQDNPSAYPPGADVGGRVITLDHPVEQVRWKESHEMLARMGLTLPTEAQWEYASRGGTRTTYWTGADKHSLQGALNIADRDGRDRGGPASWAYEPWLTDGYVVHAPVGTFRANPFGLHDTAGNVWEWCADRFAEYGGALDPRTGLRESAPNAPRVFRGGGFRAAVVHARASDRYTLYGASFRAYDVGVRAARLLDSTVPDRAR